jgi:hypothetical protein
MGICRAAIGLLARESCRLNFRGTVATLGRQHVYATAEELQQALANHRLPLPTQPAVLHREPTLAERGFISDGFLLESLGFQQVVRLDCDNYEEIDELIDLNVAETPDRLRDRFDAIFDFGTLEHIYHVPHALARLVEMTRVGGRIVHFSPASNCIEHGFYSFSPTLFRDHYQAAGFQLNQILICRMPRDFERGRWQVYEYPLEFRGSLPMGRFGSGIYYTFVVATKLSDSRVPIAAPQQASYVDLWQGSQADGASTPVENGRAAALLRQTAGIPLLEPLARSAIRCWRAIRQRWQIARQGPVPFPKLGDY